MDLDSEWNKFMKNDCMSVSEVVSRKQMDVPICDPISISTKTKIIYFNVLIDLFLRFWDFPMIQYDDHAEGIIKKQIKLNFTTREEVEKFNEYVAKDPYIKANDIITLNKIHIKMFNTGKIEIPGIQNEEMVDIAVEKIKMLLQPHYEFEVKELIEKRENILINSNFTCNYYINREELFKILKTKYHVKCSYDPCSYPGIQCKYKLSHGDISYMIFRTGSVLIVGKCDSDDELFTIYEFIKNIFYSEFMNIYEENNEIKQIKNKKKIRKTLYVE